MHADDGVGGLDGVYHQGLPDGLGDFHLALELQQLAVEGCAPTGVDAAFADGGYAGPCGELPHTVEDGVGIGGVAVPGMQAQGAGLAVEGPEAGMRLLADDALWVGSGTVAVDVE